MDPIKIKTILELHSQGLSQRDIGSQVGLSKSTIGNVVKKHANAPQEEPALHRKPQFDITPSNKINVLEVLQNLTERTSQHNQKIQDYAKVTIDTDRPIAVIKAADLHLGGMDVSYEALMTHYRFILERDDFYLQLFGDDINLMIMHKTVAARHDILTPDEQIDLLESIVDELCEKGKLLSMGWGNHSDEFTERVAGFGIVKRLARNKIPYFRGIGYLDLVVGKQTYPMGFAHKVRFNSFMHETHGNRRMEQLHSHFFGADRPICREYITAHTHNPGYSCTGCLPEDRIHYIKCGTYKTNDAYSQRYFGQGKIGIPTLVYHPDRFEHVYFPGPEQAYRYMKGVDFK